MPHGSEPHDAVLVVNAAPCTDAQPATVTVISLASVKDRSKPILIHFDTADPVPVINSAPVTLDTLFSALLTSDASSTSMIWFSISAFVIVLMSKHEPDVFPS